MKRLYITRHAKSSWEDLSVSDHDRDLIKTGETRTVKVAEYLKRNEPVPDLIVSSSALRALKTAKIFAGVLGYPLEKIKVEPSLYGCDEEDVFEILYGLSDDIKSVMIVGHNPAFTGFSNYFLKSKEQIDNLPTSGVVAVKIKTKHWTDIHLAKHKLIFKAFPKKLP